MLCCLHDAVPTECRAPGTVLTAVAGPDGGAFLQLESGAVWQYEAEGLLQPCEPLAAFPAPCMQTWPTPAELVANGGTLPLSAWGTTALPGIA